MIGKHLHNSFVRKRHNFTLHLITISTGQAHPWVVPLGTSHLDFSTHRTLKNHRKHLNEYFHFFNEHIY
jgi:hypothetical protein